MKAMKTTAVAELLSKLEERRSDAIIEIMSVADHDLPPETADPGKVALEQIDVAVEKVMGLQYLAEAVEEFLDFENDNFTISEKPYI